MCVIWWERFEKTFFLAVIFDVTYDDHKYHMKVHKHHKIIWWLKNPLVLAAILDITYDGHVYHMVVHVSHMMIKVWRTLWFLQQFLILHIMVKMNIWWSYVYHGRIDAINDNQRMFEWPMGFCCNFWCYIWWSCVSYDASCLLYLGEGLKNPLVFAAICDAAYGDPGEHMMVICVYLGGWCFIWWSFHIWKSPLVFKAIFSWYIWWSCV